MMWFKFILLGKDDMCDSVFVMFLYVFFFVYWGIECLCVDDYYVNVVVLGKVIDFGELFGVIDEVLYLFVIFFGKVFCYIFKIFEYIFVNGNIGYYDNEFILVVVLV